jgi:hypothetical protein
VFDELLFPRKLPLLYQYTAKDEIIRVFHEQCLMKNCRAGLSLALPCFFSEIGMKKPGMKSGMKLRNEIVE